MPIFTQHPGGEGYAPWARTDEEILPRHVNGYPSYWTPLHPPLPRYPSSSHHPPWSYHDRYYRQDLESLAARVSDIGAAPPYAAMDHWPC
ncbi:unnamed protein product [Linum trigynum]|uniref:Uncharacterized protein n=1 Tax=Linum trigynum TaxID=586398 RepID=A0AAV2GIV9_9ROSI